MREARRALCEAHDDAPATAREWALPVLYLRGTEALRFERPRADAPDAEHLWRQRAQIVAAALRQLAATLDLAGRRQVLAQALADVPTAYWPDPDGKLPT
jgi:hypothetical protein